VTSGMRPDRAIALSRVRKVLDRLVRDGTAVARLDGTVHRLFPVAVGPSEGAAIRSWVIREAAVCTIEVGFGYGIAALFACEGLLINGAPDARHVVIDPNQGTRFANCGLQFLDEAGVGGLVDHHAEESQIALPRLVSEGRRFDLAVVDGNHRFDAVFLDLYYLGRLLRPGGILFVDDYHLAGTVRAASFFITNLGWSLEDTSTEQDRHDWAVLRTSTEPDTRPFDYFVDFLGRCQGGQSSQGGQKTRSADLVT
jgi:predicted O-methyltransferase YrrM